MTDLGADFFSSGSTETITDSEIYSKDDEGAPSSPYKEDAEKIGAPKRARESGADIMSFAFVGVGGALINRKIDPPVGRCLTLEAPLLGKKLDEVIAGTFIDKLLQPLFRHGESAQELGAMIALPVMVGLMERKPQLAPLLAEPIAESLRLVLSDMAPLMRKKRTDTRRAVKALGDDFNEMFDVPRGEDPIPYILQGFIFREQFEAAQNAEAAQNGSMN